MRKIKIINYQITGNWLICFGIITICVVFGMNSAFAQQSTLSNEEIVKMEIAKKELELQYEAENFKVIIGVLTGSVGSFTALWGFLKYRRDEFLKKQAVFFELVKEYDNSKKMYIAKRILDGFKFTYDEIKGDFVYDIDGILAKKRLSTILREKEKSESPLSLGEIKVRESFDNLYDFFYKLYYLEKTKMLSTVEMGYFKYFIKKSLEDNACAEFGKYSSEWKTMFTHFKELNYGNLS